MPIQNRPGKGDSPRFAPRTPQKGDSPRRFQTNELARFLPMRIDSPRGARVNYPIPDWPKSGG